MQSAAVVPRLEMIGIDKAFSTVRVLRGVDFAVGAGEVVALLGSNGAGKSTLMKVLSGVNTRDAGEIRIDGQPVAINGPEDAIRAGIRLLPQELSVHPDMTVAENVSMGDMPVRKCLGISIIDRRTMRSRAETLLGRLGMTGIDPARLVGTLSLSQQRVIEIARALAGDARILIMDEPTAALAEAEAEILFDVIETLASQGVSIIYISHYLDEVFRLSQRIVVLRDGIVAGNFTTVVSSHDNVLQAMLGNTLGALFPPKTTEATHRPVLSVEGLTLPNWLDDISFTVGTGEILGVFGLIGSGIERIGRALYGAEQGVRLNAATLQGRAFRPRSPHASVQAGLGFVAAERKREGLIGILTVRDNTTITFLNRFVRGPHVDHKAETRETTRWIDALGIRTKGPEQEIRFLSGGNQQKVCLARWMLGDVRVLILEEPTRGVDLGARREIYAQIRKLAADGLGLLVISSDAEEVAGLVDRTLILNDGRVTAVLDPEADAATILAAASQTTTV
ncbi:sugar ABC transporter ATP-binding protein [Acidisoma cladoniae]|jgi:ribose transport system ATP-binding protein|uniref:sugar ABC transporter ATP-binding protein n=1 Tax=Acidisoma cladoniae TaxID=3040935 RepID=UPI00254D64A8|nr:sugar ABC transporter ATP-binding protein [Acidisoma sp. PAMC 29798]